VQSLQDRLIPLLIPSLGKTGKGGKMARGLGPIDPRLIDGFPWPAGSNSE